MSLTRYLMPKTIKQCDTPRRFLLSAGRVIPYAQTGDPRSAQTSALADNIANMPRGKAVRALVFMVVCGLGGILHAQTGTPVRSLAPYDDLVTGLLAKYNIPGASLALTQNGRLIYARGYGNSDVHRSQKVQPDSLFRVASL